VKQPSELQWVERFSLHFRVQHIMMFTSVTVLVLTAIPLWSLRSSYHALAAHIVDMFGGMDVVRIWHRTAAVMLMAGAAYHLLYIFIHPIGRRDFLLMLPTGDDFRHLAGNIRYFLRLTDQQPRFGRFTYYEKFDYWAAFWGCAIMIGSGLILWFPDKFLCSLGDNVQLTAYAVALEAHGHEAILAALALYIWHLFNVHLKPGKFPGTMVWWHGRTSAEERNKEHPLEAVEIGENE